MKNFKVNNSNRVKFKRFKGTIKMRNGENNVGIIYLLIAFKIRSSLINTSFIKRSTLNSNFSKMDKLKMNQL